jgi:hypothetical protein
VRDRDALGNGLPDALAPPPPLVDTGDRRENHTCCECPQAVASLISTAISRISPPRFPDCVCEHRRLVRYPYLTPTTSPYFRISSPLRNPQCQLVAGRYIFNDGEARLASFVTVSFASDRGAPRLQYPFVARSVHCSYDITYD